VTLAQAEPFVRLDWVLSHLGELWSRTVEHLTLTGIAVSVGFVVSLLLSLLALRYRKSYAPIAWTAGILYTIPSLALFVLLVPFTGLSLLTAEIGLVSYTLLILIRNIVAGVQATPSSVVEAARGMGYSERRLFWRIQFPLALPVIMAGLRVASVTTVGLVTVTSLIGQGGFGALILRGLRRNFSTEIVVGTLASILLATLFDVVLVAAQRWMMPWSRRRAI
jgi:osmoprotectant transport system permease protein